MAERWTIYKQASPSDHANYVHGPNTQEIEVVPVQERDEAREAATRWKTTATGALNEALGEAWSSRAELVKAMEEAIRCLTLIGHVPRSRNTWASRCQAATETLQAALAAERNRGV